MKVTVSRRKSIVDDYDNLPLQVRKQRQGISRVRPELSARQDTVRSVTCSKDASGKLGLRQWMFSQCAKEEPPEHFKDDEQEIHSQLEKANPLRNQKCMSAQSRSSSRQSKLRVTSSRADPCEIKRQYPQSLSKLKQMKIQSTKVRAQQLVKQKVTQIVQQKGCPQTHPSLSLTKPHSSKRSLQLPVQFEASRGGRQLNLAISKQMRSTTKIEDTSQASLSKQGMLSHQSQKRSQFKRSSFIESEMMMKIPTDRKSHFHHSSNQFRVIDPLEELKSLDTQYLKKKLLFSEAKSDRQDNIDRLYRLVLKSNEGNSQANECLVPKKTNQIHRSMAVLANQAQGVASVMNTSDIEEESVVLDKGMDNIFSISPGLFHKSSINGAHQNLSGSVIEHASIVDQGDLWYALS